MINNLNNTLSSLNCSSKIYDFLGRTLSAKLPKSVIIIVQLDVTLQKGYVIGFYGINLSWFNKLISIIGLNPVSKHFDITEEGKRYYYTVKKFRKFNGSIYEFAEGQLPEWIAKSVEIIYGIKSIYTIALNYANKPIGSVLVFNRDEVSGHLTTLEPFIDEISKRLYDVINENCRSFDIPEVKDDFVKIMLSNLSHEIRTPLNGIMGLMNLIKMDSNASNVIDASFYRDAWSSAQTLTHSVDSLVLASELSTKTIELKFEYFSAQRILDEVKNSIDKLSSLYHDRRILFNFKVEDNRDVKLNEFYFIYIVNELILNALKFSSDKIEVDLTIDKELSLQIRDYGIGLSEKELQVVFEHFVKISYSDKIYRGMGLGLYNSNQLANLFGGSLRMTSTQNVGSTIVLKIPVCGPNKELLQHTNDVTFMQ